MKSKGYTAIPKDLPWHLFDSWQIAALLQTHLEQGINQTQVADRLAVFGQNRIKQGKARHPLLILLDQFADFMSIALMLAAAISGLIGDQTDAVVILAIILLNALIGFTQELRAERAMAALKKLAGQSARAIRAGNLMTIPATELVPGDLVMLETGNVVPADLRLVETARLKIDEAAITGESVAVEKSTATLREADPPLGDRLNMAFKGTVVSFGHGMGVVVASGMASELGKIAALLGQSKTSKTPLQQRLTRFGKRLGMVVLAICAVIFTGGLLRGEPPMLMLLTAISLAVAAIPEALPAVATVSLALGARRLAKNNALIRRLPAVETLGSVTYICSDKTGTLTENKMHAEAFYLDGATHGEISPSFPPRFLQALALNNDCRPGHDGTLTGDPTEIALYEAAADAGYDGTALSKVYARLDEMPFDAERKLMTTLHQDANHFVAFAKGAPESVLPRCVTQWNGKQAKPIDSAAITQAAHALAQKGLRVLAIAFREFAECPVIGDCESIEADLCFLGLVGLLDPPRAEAGGAVALCRSAGILPVMITGDHPATAQSIALRLGIAEASHGCLSGHELANLDFEALKQAVKTTHIYARVSPEQKINIVRALQESGEFVAMTGDGVNDAPALNSANIGVAMGKIGTDVAREAADMVLLDDNFATLVTAIREGRRIFDNIRKFIKYAMTCNSAEIWTLFLAPFLGLPLPLLPIHILWINLVTDGLPGLALAVEPEEPGIMQRPPRPPDESILAQGMWQHILWIGLLMGGVALLTQWWAYRAGSGHWQTMVFTVLALSQMVHILAIRSENRSFFWQNLFSNTPLLLAVLLTIGLQMAVVYLPVCQTLFKTQALSGDELLVCFALSSVVFVAVEIEKWLRRRGWIYRNGGTKKVKSKRTA